MLAALYGWSYYSKSVRDAGIYQELGEGLSQDMLRDAVMSAETYKLVFGFYPNSMKELRNGYTHSDPALRECECKTDYFYQLSEDKNSYFLFSKGRDCIAFTSDDLHPVLTEQQRVNIGLNTPINMVAANKEGACDGT